MNLALRQRCTAILMILWVSESHVMTQSDSPSFRFSRTMALYGFRLRSHTGQAVMSFNRYSRSQIGVRSQRFISPGLREVCSKALPPTLISLICECASRSFDFQRVLVGAETSPILETTVPACVLSTQQSVLPALYGKISRDPDNIFEIGPCEILEFLMIFGS